VFGAGEFDELGLGAKPVGDEKPTNVCAPRRNKLLDNVIQIAVGDMYCVALTSQGRIVTWGVNDHRALGRETVWEAPTRDIDEGSRSEDSEDDTDLNPKECTPTVVPEADLGNGETHSYKSQRRTALQSPSAALV
jgi:regulator of chromosome condensation